MQRIELYQRYLSNEKEVARLKNLSVPPQPQYKYRRINPRIEDIERIIEITGDNKECIVRFYSGEEVIVKANFDDLCITFNDLENNISEEEDN